MPSLNVKENSSAGDSGLRIEQQKTETGHIELEYRQLLQNLLVAVYTTDKDGKITFYNQTAADLWGREPEIGEDSLRGSFKIFRVDGSLMPFGACPMAICLKERRPVSGVEILVGRPDGSLRHVASHPQPIFNYEGEMIGASNMLLDITDSKHLELAGSLEKNIDGETLDLKLKNEVLKRSEERYHKMIEEVEDYAIILLDKEGLIQNWNKGAEKIKGYLESEIVGRSFREFYLPEDRKGGLPEQLLAQARNQGKAVHEGWRIRKNGSRFWGSIVLTALHDDQNDLIGFSKVTRDLTERKIAEDKAKEYTCDLQRRNEELQRSEERYHKMVDEVEDYAIILLDKEGLIQNWNKGAEKIKGYLEEEIVGKSFSNFYLPKDREIGLPNKLLAQAREQGKAVHEGWRMRKNGSRFWGSIVLTALHDDQNNILGFSKVTRDLTERKMAEDTMKEYTDQLEFQNKELEQFAYAASHDLKEPLRKIHLYNTYIAENPVNILDEQSKVFLDRSISAVNRMTDLIEDLLTYSKTTTNYESFEKVDLNEIVDEVKEMYKEECEQVDVQFEIEQLPFILGIPFQVKQLMFNLINNSIKYRHPDRKASILIQTALVKGSDIDEPGAEPYLDYQKISVIDNGIGFEPEFSEKIFKIFHRLTNANHLSQGSGIGLAICKKIAQNHHGFIKATGQKNEGARFDVYFPKPQG